MIAIVCVDDSLGMVFNKRRQSSDRILRKRIIEKASHSLLWMNSYSFGQFSDCDSTNIKVDEYFAERAGNGEYCFAENIDLLKYYGKIEQLIIYRWNRKYPSDKKLNISLDNFKCVSKTDFSGSSHERITEEVWVK